MTIICVMSPFSLTVGLVYIINMFINKSINESLNSNNMFYLSFYKESRQADMTLWHAKAAGGASTPHRGSSPRDDALEVLQQHSSAGDKAWDVGSAREIQVNGDDLARDLQVPYGELHVQRRLHVRSCSRVRESESHPVLFKSAQMGTCEDSFGS